MMPTLQKSSLILTDENANSVIKNVSAIDSKGESINSSVTNQVFACKSLECNSKSQKMLIDQINNNIVFDSLSSNKENLSNDCSIREQTGVQREVYNTKSPLHCSSPKKDNNEDVKSRDSPKNGRDNQIKSPDKCSNRDSQLSQVSTISSIASPDNQKSKHKKFSTNKNQDSSSSNGSLGGLAKDEPPLKVWKFSKTHQKRFKRRFPKIEPDEQLIDWYSCALIADILLQGYLYISENYIAFYSNIFGYKTHVLVNMSDIYAITKEKTAKIFPNAVGIHTKSNKFVFGSLLSRENTFKLLNEVRGSYLNLNKEKQTTTDLSEDDLIDNVAKSSVDQNESSNVNLKADEHAHSQDQTDHLKSEHHKLEHHKFDSLRRHRRSSSLKLTNREIIGDHTDLVLRSRRPSKLLNDTNKFDINHLLVKLTSLKSIFFRFDLKESKSSFLIFCIAFLLFLLLISISVLLVRINSAHDKLISMSKYSHLAPNMDLFDEMYRVMEVMRTNMNEISQLKSKLN